MVARLMAVAALASLAAACHGERAGTVRIPAEDNADAALEITCSPPAARVRFPAPRGGYTTIELLGANDGGVDTPTDSLAVRFARTSPHWNTVEPGVMVADSAAAVLRALDRPARDSVTLFVSTRLPPVMYRFPVWRHAGACADL